MKVAALFRPRRISPTASIYLDAWRGGSSIAVMLTHAANIFMPGPRTMLADVVGAVSVMAFFVLSGFFIHKSLAGSFRADGPDIGAFARARINRIVPAFIACLALTVALYFLAPHVFASGTRVFINATEREAFSLDGLGITAVFLNGFAGPTLSANGPLWSLSYEVWYYVFFAAAALMLYGSRIALLAVPVLIAGVAVNQHFAILGIVWLAGCAVSVLHAADALSRVSWLRLPMLAVTVALFGYAMSTSAHPTHYGVMLVQLAFGAWFALHLARKLDSQTNGRAVLLLAGTAPFSYTLYLTHFPLMLFLFGILDGRPVGVIVACLAAVGAIALAMIIGRVERVVLVPKKLAQAQVVE
jgi:peptidoglycan/LPS O-acetylase OafA/YrhL